MKDAWRLILGVLFVLVAVGVELPRNDLEPAPPHPPVVVVDPDTSPFQADHLTVLVVEDSGRRRDLPASQVDIFTSSKIRKLIADNGGECRFWSVTEDGEFDSPAFRDAVEVPRESVPWIVIANGKRGFSGPLPMNVDGVIALVEKFK